MSNRHYTDDPLADDPWAEGIAKFLSNQTETSVADVLLSEIEKPLPLWTLRDQERVQRILQALGWKRVREGDQFTLKYRRTVASNVTRNQ